MGKASWNDKQSHHMTTWLASRSAQGSLRRTVSDSGGAHRGKRSQHCFSLTIPPPPLQRSKEEQSRRVHIFMASSSPFPLPLLLSKSLPHFRKSSNPPTSDPLYPTTVIVWPHYCPSLPADKVQILFLESPTSCCSRSSILPPPQLSLLTLLLFRPNIPPANRTQISLESPELLFHIWPSVSLRLRWCRGILQVSRNSGLQHPCKYPDQLPVKECGLLINGSATLVKLKSNSWGKGQD